MPKRYASFFALLLVLAPLALRAQDAAPPTRTSRFLAHFDLGVSGIAYLTKGVTGTVNNPTLGTPYDINQTSSTAAAFLITLRGEKSPYKGFEINYSRGRVTESYNCSVQTLTRCNADPGTGSQIGPFLAQSTVAEYTAGYLARPRHKIFGFQPYVSVGAGVNEFTPTKNGGGGAGTVLQARATYYWTAGGEDMLVGDTLGLRVGVRQLFYKAPDLGQNFLQINKLTFTTEPQVGIYLHF